MLLNSLNQYAFKVMKAVREKKPLLFKHEFVDCEYYLLYVSTKTWHSCF